jgi:sugar phosphate permease
MLQQLLYLFIYIVVIGLVAWLLTYLVDMLPIDARLAQILRVIIMVFCVIAVIYLLLGLIGATPRLGRL